MGLILKIKNADFSKNNIGTTYNNEELKLMNIEGLYRWFDISEKYINTYNDNYRIKEKNKNEYFGNTQYASYFDKTGINSKPCLSYYAGHKGGIIVNDLFDITGSYTVSFVCEVNSATVSSGIMLSNNSGNGFGVVVTGTTLEVRNSSTTKKTFNSFFEYGVPCILTIEYDKEKNTLTIYKNGHIFNSVTIESSPLSSKVIFLNIGDNVDNAMQLGDVFTFNTVLSKQVNKFELVHNYLKSKYSIS